MGFGGSQEVGCIGLSAGSVSLGLMWVLHSLGYLKLKDKLSWRVLVSVPSEQSRFGCQNRLEKPGFQLFTAKDIA